MLLACIIMATLQAPTWSVPEENIRIKSSDCVVIARITAPADWSERQLFTSENAERAGDKVWVARVPMRAILTLKGSIATEFVYVQSQESKLEVGGAGAAQRLPDRLAEASVGSLVLVWLHRPIAHDLLPSPRGTDHYFRRSGNQELVYPSIEPIPVLPEANYIVEGQTAVEKYSSVLVQAYAKDPAAPNAVAFLEKLAQVKPWWKRQNGNVVASRPEMDGPGFFGFARSKLIPRLMETQGNDIVRKLRAHYFAYLLAGDEEIKNRHQQLVQELDSTWPNANDASLLDGIIGSREYLLGRLGGRVASVRIVAMRALPPKPENIGAIVGRLQSDSSFYVHHAAAEWLQRLKMTNLDLYRDAPIARGKLAGAIENRQALIDYWSAR